MNKFITIVILFATMLTLSSCDKNDKDEIDLNLPVTTKQ